LGCWGVGLLGSKVTRRSAIRALGPQSVRCTPYLGSVQDKQLADRREAVIGSQHNWGAFPARVLGVGGRAVGQHELHLRQIADLQRANSAR